jgi:hypothetical protein
MAPAWSTCAAITLLFTDDDLILVLQLHVPLNAARATSHAASQPARRKAAGYCLMRVSPVATSSVHSLGSGSHNLPSPISSGIHK